ncbi:MAG: hypothetical protein A2V77_04995 [Anaeromyxobacter sp. RBG_16_69_14]|nr:MAG: hypothetical protein A2V77_04995 [Anaeromyxobacter sp. RBG_16_69_14]
MVHRDVTAAHVPVAKSGGVKVPLDALPGTLEGRRILGRCDLLLHGHRSRERQRGLRAMVTAGALLR